jgi:hypothetical protein
MHPTHSIQFTHVRPCRIANSRVRTLSQIGGHDRAGGQQSGEYWLIVLLLRAGVAPANTFTPYSRVEVFSSLKAQNLGKINKSMTGTREFFGMHGLPRYFNQMKTIV